MCCPKVREQRGLFIEGSMQLQILRELRCTRCRKAFILLRYQRPSRKILLRFTADAHTKRHSWFIEVKLARRSSLRL